MPLAPLRAFFRCPPSQILGDDARLIICAAFMFSLRAMSARTRFQSCAGAHLRLQISRCPTRQPRIADLSRPQKRSPDDAAASVFGDTLHFHLRARLEDPMEQQRRDKVDAIDEAERNALGGMTPQVLVAVRDEREIQSDLDKPLTARMVKDIITLAKRVSVQSDPAEHEH
jgi:hypothetical protein